MGIISSLNCSQNAKGLSAGELYSLSLNLTLSVRITSTFNFRHTYAHNMLNKGVPKEVLQTLLGHRSIKTTEIYANWVRKEELERWV